MRMRLKEEITLSARESDLGLHGDVLLKAGDIFEVTKMNGGCKLERDGMRIYAAGEFDTFLMEEVKE